jgi:hypothetical protein
VNFTPIILYRSISVATQRCVCDDAITPRYSQTFKTIPSNEQSARTSEIRGALMASLRRYPLRLKTAALSVPWNAKVSQPPVLKGQGTPAGVVAVVTCLLHYLQVTRRTMAGTVLTGCRLCANSQSVSTQRLPTKVTNTNDGDGVLDALRMCRHVLSRQPICCRLLVYIACSYFMRQAGATSASALTGSVPVGHFGMSLRGCRASEDADWCTSNFCYVPAASSTLSSLKTLLFTCHDNL